MENKPEDEGSAQLKIVKTKSEYRIEVSSVGMGVEEIACILPGVIEKLIGGKGDEVLH